MRIDDEGERNFFFEKKKQKTFICSRLLSGPTVAAQTPGVIEVFCALFFKKALLSYFARVGLYWSAGAA